MSRIHEALKRAEQERAASQGTRTDGTPVMDLPATESVPAMPETAHGSKAATTTAPGTPGNGQGTPSFTTSFTFDTLLARCAQGEWKPDEKTMLFFNAEENALGTEQFRTLHTLIKPRARKNFVRCARAFTRCGKKLR